MILSNSISPTYTQTVSESCQGDSTEFIENYPAANGAQIRHMMHRCGITISKAATLFDITKRCVRMRRRYGVSAGVHSWEWMRWLPQRSVSIKALNSASAWTRSSKSQSMKLFTITNWSECIPCIAIKWVPDSFKEQRILHASDKFNDSGNILFGRLDSKWSSHRGRLELPVLSKRPEDQLRAYGSNTLLMAYQYIEQHWDVLVSGETINLTTVPAASNPVCRNQILEQDRGARLAGSVYP